MKILDRIHAFNKFIANLPTKDIIEKIKKLSLKKKMHRWLELFTNM